MKRWYRLVFFVITVLFHLTSAAQTNPDCETNPPVPPVLISVSIEPQTGMTELKWELSPSPDVTAYIVYSEHPTQDGLEPKDTIKNPLATSYKYYDPGSQYKSLPYYVSAFRLPKCTSIFSNSLNTIFCTAVIDTCRRSINLKWNKYSDVPLKVVRYEILLTKNGETETYFTDPNVTELNLTSFDIDTEYTFSVRAVLEGGAVSSSRNNVLITSMARAPEWINADYATINSEGKIELSYTFDQASEIKKFMLERKSGYGGSFGNVAEFFSDNGKILYVDDQADIRKINFYRLSAVNNCNPPLKISNLSSNIVTQILKTGSDMHLTWNPYKSWQGAISGYRIMINSGDGFRELDFVQPSDTLFVLPYSEIISFVTGSEICFRIKAEETGNPYGIIGESISSESCISNEEVITVPDLFTPDGDNINDLFKPVLSFIPLKFHMIISNRSGRIVFETNSIYESWDGTYKGKPLPGDVYLWFVETTGPSGKRHTKTGTITIYRNR